MRKRSTGRPSCSSPPAPPHGAHRQASLVGAGLCLLGLGLLVPLALGSWERADDTPPALAALRAHADPERNAGQPRSVVMLLIDGLRTDEAEALPAFRTFAASGASGQLRMSAPTLSSPAYHAFLTGVPAWASGVRTNRFQARPRSTAARADTLFDRARSAGMRGVYAAEGLRWLLSFAADTATADANVLPVGARFEAGALRHLARAAEPGRITLLHMLAVDESAHELGIRSEEHRQALAGANRLIAALHAATRGTDTVAMVLSDHGHLDAGGHGGNEVIVQRAPFAVAAPGLPPQHGVRMQPEEVAPTLAALARLQAPRHALRAASAVLVGPNAHEATSVVQRASAARRAQAAFLARAERYTCAGGLLALLLGALGLWALRRAFGRFDAATLLSPPLWLALSLVAHVHVLGRPLSVSAIDLVGLHVLTLALTSTAAATLAIAAGVRVAVALGAQPLAALRRAAATLGWAAFGLFVASVSLIGGSLAPWPESELLAYGPVLFGGFAGGALLAMAASLLGGLVFGSRLERGPQPSVQTGRVGAGYRTVTAARPHPAK
ncbi:MAG: alkaline phosphatase family protein [Sandaracinaceae bacterium]|nr:alkaline phosphatase family protein [Sandaracinaceae bacterium]